MSSIKWGIIGPGNIAHKFADGLKESFSGQLIAIASTSEERRKNFGDKYNINTSFRFSNIFALFFFTICQLKLNL